MNTDDGKVNWGTLVDIPEICVDRFGSLNPEHFQWATSRAFFLTHYDDEILQDVLSSSFLNRIKDPENNCRLYLHEMAFRYLKYFTTTVTVENGQQVDAQLDELKKADRIVCLETNHTIHLWFKISEQQDRFVDVTALSSGSNFGCIMLLFERVGRNENDCRILYSGDCRVTLNDLRQMNSLHNPDGSVKKLHKLYLDTFYCVEDAKELPTRHQVTEKLLAAVEASAKRDPKKHFEFSTPSKSHHLAFVLKVAEKFPEGIHVPTNLAFFLHNLPQFIDRDRVQWGSGDTDRFHFDCGESCDNQFCGNGFEWAIEFDVSSVSLCSNFLYHNETIKFIPTTDDERQWLRFRQCVYTKADNFHGIYSCHLSRFEMGRFANYFGVKPLEIIPLRKSPRMSANEFEILLEIACADGEEEPKYLSEELPSTFYDFTTSSKAPNDDSSQKYVHEICKTNENEITKKFEELGIAK